MATQAAQPPATDMNVRDMTPVPARFKPREYAALKTYAESEGRSMSMQLKVWALDRMKQLGLLDDGNKPAG